jgi:hypothetical protein
LSYLDGGFVGEDESASTPVTVGSAALHWPIYVVGALSVAGIVVAIFGSVVASLVAYGVLLFAGCGLLFYRRFDAILQTRNAGGVGAVGVQPIEKITIGVLALACLANGFVIALDVASWQVWADLWGSD